MIILKVSPDTICETIAELNDVSNATSEILIRFEEIMSKLEQQVGESDEQHKLIEASTKMKDLINACNAYAEILNNAATEYMKLESAFADGFFDELPDDIL